MTKDEQALRAHLERIADLARAIGEQNKVLEDMDLELAALKYKVQQAYVPKEQK